jgi:hypothetical protein
MPNHPGRELGTIVRSDILGDTILYIELCYAAQDIIRLPASFHHKSQAFPAVFVDDSQDPEGTPVMGPAATKSYDQT